MSWGLTVNNIIEMVFKNKFRDCDVIDIREGHVKKKDNEGMLFEFNARKGQYCMTFTGAEEKEGIAIYIKNPEWYGKEGDALVIQAWKKSESGKITVEHSWLLARHISRPVEKMLQGITKQLLVAPRDVMKDWVKSDSVAPLLYEVSTVQQYLKNIVAGLKNLNVETMEFEEYKISYGETCHFSTELRVVNKIKDAAHLTIYDENSPILGIQYGTESNEDLSCVEMKQYRVLNSDECGKLLVGQKGTMMEIVADIAKERQGTGNGLKTRIFIENCSNTNIELPMFLKEYVENSLIKSREFAAGILTRLETVNRVLKIRNRISKSISRREGENLCL